MSLLTTKQEDRNMSDNKSCIHWTKLDLCINKTRQGLGDAVDFIQSEIYTGNLIVLDGRIDTWHQCFIAAPGEDPDWDTPHRQVDWSGFTETLKVS
jgi:hypothetical protein